MVEVRVNHHVDVGLATFFDDGGHRIGPGIVGQELLRHHGQALGSKADAPHVRDCQEGLAKKRDLLGAKLGSVAARNQHVLDFGPRRDVGDGRAPALDVHAEGQLVNLLRVETDGVAARAKAAVHRAGRYRQEQNLVGIAVR